MSKRRSPKVSRTDTPWFNDPELKARLQVSCPQEHVRPQLVENIHSTRDGCPRTCRCWRFCDFLMEWPPSIPAVKPPKAVPQPRRRPKARRA